MASTQGLAPSTRTLLFLSAAVVVLAGVHMTREVLAPLFLAAVLVIIVHPIRHPLERRGWHRAAATTVVIVVVYLILLVLIAMLVFAGIQFAGLVQEYLQELQDAVGGATSWLATLGLDQDAVKSATDAFQPSQLLGVATSISGWLHTCFSWLSIASTAPRRPKLRSCSSIRGIQRSTVAW